MSSLATFSSLAHAASNGLANHAYAVCRDVCLPRTSAVLPRLRAIVTAYRAATGRYLDAETAAMVLDRLISDRDDVPFPASYAPIADLLCRAGYTADAIHEIVGHLRRHGTTAGLGSWLAPGHRTEVELLIPEIGPKRGSWGHSDEDESEGDE